MIGKPSDFRLPGPTHRAWVGGRTGSGKTQYGDWLLSHANFDEQPWVIIDYKYDDLLNSVDRVKEIGISEKLPKHPGLYITHPLPSEEEEVEAWLWKVWARERIGLFVDEGYRMPASRRGAFNAILTQGRSKKIPAIVLSQRPSFLPKFVFTEADFFTVFHLSNPDDRKTVEGFTDPDMYSVRLADYHSRWYDVAKDKFLIVKPVPSADEIASRIHDRLVPGKRKFV